MPSKSSPAPSVTPPLVGLGHLRRAHGYSVDDVIEDNDEVGAGMMGTVQLMSSTLYRFATLDVESLAENLGDRDAAVTAPQPEKVNAHAGDIP